MDGRVAHSWPVPDATCQAFYGHLLDNGNLLSLYIRGGEYRPGGCRLACELDWNGNVVWQHDEATMHHDIIRRTNGNTLFVHWQPVPPEYPVRVRGGLPRASSSKGIVADGVREVTAGGETVYQWNAYEALDPAIDEICPLHKLEEWTHCNSLKELPNGDLLVCFRLLNTVMIVDRGSGKIRWRWGQDYLGHQHDAQPLPNGNILIMDNGFHIVGNAQASRIVEVDPTTNEVKWQFVGNPTISFFSANVGGAQRLPNGNTLICEGMCGRLFEVTLDGTVVWEYVTPHVFRYREDVRGSRISRARRYASDSPQIRGRLP
jgi:hypothetical protein